MLISYNNIENKIEENILVKNFNIVINEGDRICLTGKNGSGKTSLLNCLYDNFLKNSANIKTSNDVIIGYFKQIAIIELSKKTILEYIMDLSENWLDILDLCNKIFAYEIIDLSKSVTSLSGGEITKLCISCSLVNKPKILFLDEPTNNLDLYSIQMLEKFIALYKGVIIFVSHNQDFNDSIANKIIELTGNGNYLVFTGSYNDYLNSKINLEKNRLASITSLNKKAISYQNSLETEEIKHFKGAKNTKKKYLEGSIDRVQYGGKRTSLGNLTSVRPMIQKRIDKVTEDVFQLKANSYGRINFKPIENSIKVKVNSKLINIENGSLIIDNVQINSKINIKLNFGQSIGIIGKNGVGKTLFVKTIFNQIRFSNNIAFNYDKYYINENANISYMDQKYEIIDQHLDSTLIDFVALKTGYNYTESRHLLSNFNFYDQNIVKKKLRFLSGGEKARLTLCIVLSREVSVLILDELTNNLDIDSIEQIVKCLQDFSGSIVCISHDLSFLKKLKIMQIVEVKS